MTYVDDPDGVSDHDSGGTYRIIISKRNSCQILSRIKKVYMYYLRTVLFAIRKNANTRRAFVSESQKKNPRVVFAQTKLTSNGSGRHGLEGAHLSLVDDGLCELVEVVVTVVGERNPKQCAVQSTKNREIDDENGNSRQVSELKKGGGTLCRSHSLRLCVTMMSSFRTPPTPIESSSLANRTKTYE